MTSVTFYRWATADGVVVKVATSVNKAELKQGGVASMPKIALSRNGLTCRYPLDKMYDHICWPIHKNEEDATAYANRIHTDIKAWCDKRGIDLQGGTEWTSTLGEAVYDGGFNE